VKYLFKGWQGETGCGLDHKYLASGRCFYFFVVGYSFMRKIK